MPSHYTTQAEIDADLQAGVLTATQYNIERNKLRQQAQVAQVAGTDTTGNVSGTVGLANAVAGDSTKVAPGAKPIQNTVELLDSLDGIDPNSSAGQVLAGAISSTPDQNIGQSLASTVGGNTLTPVPGGGSDLPPVLEQPVVPEVAGPPSPEPQGFLDKLVNFINPGTDRFGNEKVPLSDNPPSVKFGGEELGNITSNINTASSTRPLSQIVEEEGVGQALTNLLSTGEAKTVGPQGGALNAGQGPTQASLDEANGIPPDFVASFNDQLNGTPKEPQTIIDGVVQETGSIRTEREFSDPIVQPSEIALQDEVAGPVNDIRTNVIGGASQGGINAGTEEFLANLITKGGELGRSLEDPAVLNELAKALGQGAQALDPTGIGGRLGQFSEQGAISNMESRALGQLLSGVPLKDVDFGSLSNAQKNQVIATSNAPAATKAKTENLQADTALKRAQTEGQLTAEQQLTLKGLELAGDIPRRQLAEYGKLHQTVYKEIAPSFGEFLGIGPGGELQYNFKDQGAFQSAFDSEMARRMGSLALDNRFLAIHDGSGKKAASGF